MIVKKAFEKQLAIEKVGLECELKLSKLAMENNDSHTCHFIGCCTEMKVGHKLVPSHACNISQPGRHSDTVASPCSKLPLAMRCNAFSEIPFRIADAYGRLMLEASTQSCAHELSAGAQMQAKKVHCLSGIVAHLKSVEGCHHAIKDFDRELECKVECCAKAAGVEAVICCRCAPALGLKLHVSCCAAVFCAGRKRSAWCCAKLSTVL